MTEERTQAIVEELTPGNGAGGSVTSDCEMVPDEDIPKFRKVTVDDLPPLSARSLDSIPGQVHFLGPALEFEIIEPIENHVFIRPDEKSAMSPSGQLYLPDSVKEATPERGEVLYVGPGIEVEGKFNPTKISPGDRVIFHRHSGTAVTVNNEELVCMRENGVFGIIRSSALGADPAYKYKSDLSDLEGKDPNHISMVEQGIDGDPDA